MEGTVLFFTKEWFGMDNKDYEIRRMGILQHIAFVMPNEIPEISNNLSFKGVGFRALPPIVLEQGSENRTLQAHGEGGYWIAKMYCEPNQPYNQTVERMMLIMHAEEASGKKRAIEVSDFMLASLIRTYYLYQGKINVSEKVWQQAREVFLRYPYATFHEHMSENHKILHLSSAYVAVHLFPEEVFYDGLTGNQKKPVLKHAIAVFLNKRLKYGWGEFDSSGYYHADFCALLNLVDFQPDDEVKKLAAKTIDFMFADLAHHSVNGYVGGPKGRVRMITSTKAGLSWPLYLYTGYPQDFQLDLTMEGSVGFFATSEYRVPQGLLTIASDRTQPYEVQERSLLYTIPDDMQVNGSIKRYHYVTQHYVLGSILQRDDYGDLKGVHGWLDGHQELSWSLVLGNSPNEVVFSSHPGHKGLEDWGPHDYWTGDTHCVCHRFVQHKNVLLGMNIISKTEQRQWTHFFIPCDRFERVEEKFGWLLLQSKQVIVAIYVYPGYYWTRRGEWAYKELVVPATKSAFTVEVVERNKFTMEQLIECLKDRHVDFEGEMAVYLSEIGTELRLKHTGQGWIDGVLQDYSNYPKYKSRHVYSDWGSDRMVLTDDNI